jgi:hypothetical protein
MNYRYYLLCLTSLFIDAAQAISTDYSGRVAAELRSTLAQPDFQTDPRHQVSALFESEIKIAMNEKNALTFAPFIRLDQADANRQHADIRELIWRYAQQDWEVRAGVGKVFWGVLESHSLVDVINQRDMLEGYEGKQKLGQPMVNFRHFTESGTFEVFILPYFREREYPAATSALTAGVNLNNDAIYQSSAKQKHLDWALRWSGNFENWELGLAWFKGTNRVPYLLPLEPGQLLPYYTQIDQHSIDVQYIDDEWLYKAELLSRRELGQRQTALGIGFERTFVRAIANLMDVSTLVEYYFDDRHLAANTSMQNDIFLGGRLAFNDVHDLKLRFGIVWDLSQDSHFYKFEASRRLDKHWFFSIEAHAFSSQIPRDPVALLDQGDFINASINFYF